MDVVAPAKTVHCFTNNKPWVTQEVKAVLNRKKVAFRSKDRKGIKSAQREVKEAKDIYRRKVEQKLSGSCMREVWDGVNTITGHKTKSVTTARGTVEEANRLNNFF